MFEVTSGSMWKRILLSIYFHCVISKCSKFITCILLDLRAHDLDICVIKIHRLFSGTIVRREFSSLFRLWLYLNRALYVMFGCMFLRSPPSSGRACGGIRLVDS